MSPDALKSCRIKIDRAEKHLADLDLEIADFCQRKPYRIIVDEDTEPAVKIYRVKIVEPVPDCWSAYIGDIIHNTRSALDCLATSLIILNGHTSNSAFEDAYFPIRSDEAGLSGDSPKRFFKRAGPKVERLIRRLQPYSRGKGNALWILNKLDTIDKHRAIIPVGARTARMTVWSSKPPAGELNKVFPLKDGDELFRSVFFEEHFDTNPEIAFFIAFGEGQLVDGEPVVPALRQLVDFSKRVIEIFERRIFEAH